MTEKVISANQGSAQNMSQTAQPPDESAPRHTTIPAAPPRMVMVYSNLFPTGRPAVVVGGPFGASPMRANVNVFLDGVNDPYILGQFKQRVQGNTIANIAVFEAQTDDQRTRALREFGVTTPGVQGATFIAEWPKKT